MNMKKTILIILLYLSSTITTQVVALTGFGPAEMFTSNQKDTKIIGNATLINKDNIAKYGVFQLIVPYTNKDTYQIIPSEIGHARVVCNNCGNEMQRNEAIPGYKYGDPLNGTCTKCGSHDLTFYTVIPRDEFEQLSIQPAGNFHMEKIAPHTWKTVEKISPNGCCNIYILYNAKDSYIPENFGKHWEVHLRATTTTDEQQFIMGGIDMRLLIDFKFPLFIELLDKPEKGKNFTVKITYGPPDREWEKIPPTPVIVDFNGIKKQIDQNGKATFTYPYTRGDYIYKITATGEEYLTATKTIQTSSEDNPYLLKIAFIIIILCVVIIASRYLYSFLRK